MSQISYRTPVASEVATSRVTIADRLSMLGGMGPGFDFLRVFLAIVILAFHTASATGHIHHIGHSPLWFTEATIVPMFFALSGFLVTASGQRLSLGNFLLNRGLRIVPALSADIIICALILGPIVTTLPLARYFTSPDFFKYFLNSFGWIHYYLPGVFRQNPIPRVNGALWTIPYEILGYAFVSVLIAAKFIRSAQSTAICVALYFAAGCLLRLEQHWHLLPHVVERVASVFVLGRGPHAVNACLAGILIYQLRDRIPYSKALLACAIAANLVIFCLGPHIGAAIFVQPVLMASLAYITVFIGVTEIPVPKFFKTGDYSYGIYLYHTPIIQCIVALFPAFALGSILGAVGTFLIATVLVIGVAYASWHLLEKRILGLRKKFSFVARVRGAELGIPGAVEPAPAKPVTAPVGSRGAKLQGGRVATS